MRRVIILSLCLIALFALSSATLTLGQGFTTLPTATPNSDTDGDGLPNTRDLCPTEPGPRENNGCPQTFPPPNAPPDNPPPNNLPPASGGDNPQPSGDVVNQPPFNPPSLPPDQCSVTPARDNRVNVRRSPSMDAEVLGVLMPGLVYPALGYVVNNAEVWMQLTNYEGSDGTVGYAAQSVVMSSSFCPRIDITMGDAADGFTSNPPDQPDLCYLSVGYDPAFWGSDYDAQLGDDPIVYAAFYFERQPGQPIFEGTPVWGVVSMDGYHELPPDSPLYFQDPDHAVAVASDQSDIDAAVSGGLGTAFNMAYPNPNGGVQAANGTIFYRLSDPEHVGNCGPIVAIDDLVSRPEDDGGDPQALQCFTHPGTTIVESCWCQTSDSACVDFLTSICYGGGAYVESGPDMTACWYEPAPAAAANRPGRLILAVSYQLGQVCEDDLSVWWIDLPRPTNDPFVLHDLGHGNCNDGFDQLPSMSRPSGAARMIARLPRPGINNLTGEASIADCDANGEIDAFQTPTPDCMLTRNADKEHVSWWQQVLDLTCPGGWIMATEIDADGDEVVTDATCDD
ncbi:MAG: hypothetical protein U0670_14475 [Anaerolineae bacterium]